MGTKAGKPPERWHRGLTHQQVLASPRASDQMVHHREHGGKPETQTVPVLDSDAIFAAADVGTIDWNGTPRLKDGWWERVQAGIRAAGADPADVAIVTTNKGTMMMMARDGGDCSGAWDWMEHAKRKAKAEGGDG